jgi:hypothetical protein
VVPADTTPEAWCRQLDAVAALTMEQRLEAWAALNDAVAEMHAAAIRRRHPDYSDRQVFLAMVRQWYGDELATAAYPDSVGLEP